MARLFRNESKFDDANAQVERAKLHAINAPYELGLGMELQARVWRGERRTEDAKSETLRAVDTFTKLGAVKELERCKALLQDIEGEMKELVTSSESPETVLPRAPVNCPLSAQASPQTYLSTND